MLTKREENRLPVFKRKDIWLKKSRRCAQEKVYNFELDREFNSPNVIGVVKTEEQ
jgi:hypothetical protein